MNRKKINDLICALADVLPFSMEMQEGFQLFLSGKLRLCDDNGRKLNPYDYVDRKGVPTVRFGYTTRGEMMDWFFTQGSRKNHRWKGCSNPRCDRSHRQGPTRSCYPERHRSHERRIFFDRLQLVERVRSMPRLPQDRLQAMQYQVAFVVESGGEQ